MYCAIFLASSLSCGIASSLTSHAASSELNVIVKFLTEFPFSSSISYCGLQEAVILCVAWLGSFPPAKQLDDIPREASSSALYSVCREPTRFVLKDVFMRDTSQPKSVSSSVNFSVKNTFVTLSGFSKPDFWHENETVFAIHAGSPGTVALASINVDTVSVYAEQFGDRSIDIFQCEFIIRKQLKKNSRHEVRAS